MKLAEVKVSTWSQKISEKMRKFEKFQNVRKCNLGKCELGESREINFKAAFKILRWS